MWELLQVVEARTSSLGGKELLNADFVISSKDDI